MNNNNLNLKFKSNFSLNTQHFIRIKIYKKLKQKFYNKSIFKLVNLYYKIRKYRKLNKIRYAKKLKYLMYFNLYKKLNKFRFVLFNIRKRKKKIESEKKKENEDKYVIKFKSLYYNNYLKKKEISFFSNLFCFYLRKRKSKTSFKTNFLKFKNIFLKKGFAGRKEKDIFFFFKH